jgi:hypothetical protein
MNVHRWSPLIRYLLVISACAMCAGGQGEQPSQQGNVRTVTVPVPDGKPGGFCFEPHVTADPENPERVLVAAMFIEGKKPQIPSLVAWRSEDGGRSWSGPAAPLGSSSRPADPLKADWHWGADAVLAFSKGKTCWLAGLDQLGYPVKLSNSSLKVSLSEDGGKMWKPPITIDEVKGGRGLVDKPWLAVDNGNGERRGTLYAAWDRQNFDTKRCELWCAALPPGAQGFRPQVGLGEPPDLKSGFSHHVQLAVHPDGTLHAVWRADRTDRLVHAFSKDGARSFSKPRPIAPDPESGTGQFPSLTVTPGGNLLAAWTNPGGVFCSVLASGRWSTPRPVAGELPDGVRLSRPAVAATEKALWVLTFRTEEKPGRMSFVLYRSDDRGGKWEQDRVLATREVSDREARGFSPGDYVGLAAAKDRLYAAYVLPGEKQEGARRTLYLSAITTRKDR